MKKNHITKLWIFLLAFAFLIPISSAAYVSLTNTVVNQNQVFDVNINIDPLGKPISGAQLDIEFNRSMFKINNISEGKLFTQNNATTFFSQGVIKNTTGNAKNIFNVIIGNHSVSSPGVFIVVNMTAIGSGGSSSINLSEVKISDPDALPVTVQSINGSIKINSTTAPIPDNKPPNSVTNLRNITFASSFINWTWTDPQDTDFNKVMIYIDGNFQTNVTKGKQYYNATVLTPNLTYIISTRTLDISGNINLTWVNKTAMTSQSNVGSNSSNIKGQIIHSYDVTGIPGVEVKITDSNGTNKSTITNSTGYYNFSNIKQDVYLIGLSKPTFFLNSTSFILNKGETKNINFNMWLKGDLNNNGISADAGDLAMMQDASVKKITPDWRFDLNSNNFLADAGDLAMIQDASVKKIILI